MPVPQEKEIRRPLLESVRGESPQNFSVNDFLRIMAKHFGEDINEMSSVDKNTFKSRIKEARSYLKRHKLLSNPSLQAYMVTKTGLDILDKTTGIIDDDCLKSLEESLPALEPLPVLPELDDAEVESETSEIPDEEAAPEVEDITAETEEVLAAEEDMPGEEAATEPEDITLDDEEEVTPEPEDYSEDTNGEEIMPDEEIHELDEESQSIEDVLEHYNSELADRVLTRAASLSSETFEVLVIDLLSKMGYRAFHNARYTNSPTDNGMIQGVILDIQGNAPIYIHAQKLSPGRTVGRSDIQSFVEALEDKGGTGIFATTAEFSENAAAYAQDERIMLIDGAKLAGLMIAHNFCVNVERVVEIKEIDEDSFNDYER